MTAPIFYPNKNVAEDVTTSIDFTARLGTGVTVTAAAVTAAVWFGTDASPSTILSGAPAVVNSTVIAQVVQGGVAGVSYLLTFTATCSDGETLVAQRVLPVISLLVPTVQLVVETGQAATNSNAYIDAAFATAWHTNKGNSFWNTLSPDQMNAMIVRATFYIEQRFKRRYRGLRQTVEQALGWPRIGAFDDDAFVLFGIPNQLMNATAEYALRAAWYGELAPDPMRTVPSQDFSQTPPTTQANMIIGPTRTVVQKIGPLEQSTTYDGMAGRAIQDERTTRSAQSGMVNDYYIPEYPAGDLWLEQLVRNPATGTTLVRGT